MIRSVAELDREHLWHPYAALGADSLVVREARGVRLVLEDGTELIDGMSSWWSVIHGYRHPVLDAALIGQAGRMSHVMFGGLTHQPAATLAERLLRVAPSGLHSVFFCDSGSVSVEVALKMALQFQASTGQPRRTKMLALRGGYHGDTFGAMSVTDPGTGYRQPVPGVAEQVFLPRPSRPFGEALRAGDRDEWAKLFRLHAPELAAVIVEPVVQGAGGMWFYSAEYLSLLRELCDESGVLLICDEIATGFGRTGSWFASEHAGVVPDILCVGKALTGGYLSLAATLTTRNVADGIAAGQPGVLLHGPTFMANPLACAVANASVDLLLLGTWQEDVRGIEAGLRRGLEVCRGLPGVIDVRVLGAVGVVELSTPIDVAQVQRRATQAGVWLRPFRNLVYTMPAYCSTADEVAQITAAMAQSIAGD